MTYSSTGMTLWDWRCPSTYIDRPLGLCNALLFKASTDEAVEIKCRNCGALHFISGVYDDSGYYRCDIDNGVYLSETPATTGYTGRPPPGKCDTPLFEVSTGQHAVMIRCHQCKEFHKWDTHCRPVDKGVSALSERFA